MSDHPAPEPEPGLRKSFWEHVEDLRKAIIRSMTAIFIALVLCLLMADKLVSVLLYPLSQLDFLEKPKPTVAFKVGDRQFGPYIVPKDFYAVLSRDSAAPNKDETATDKTNPPAPKDEEAPHNVYRVGLATINGVQVPTLIPEPPPQPHKPESSLQVHLSNFGPQEGFIVSFKVGLYGALIVSSPFWIWNILGFILPALNRRERAAIFPWLAWGAVLFATGVLLTYFFLLPLALRASVMYSNWLGFDGGDWRAQEYIAFTSKFLLGMGLGFEFPIVVLFLVKIGVLTHRDLSKYRRHVIVLNFILGAVLTTPEVLTQVAMAVPLCLLYEACIWIAWYWDWKKRRAEAAGRT